MTKVDVRKRLKHLYQPSAKTVSLVTVPGLDFLMIDGSGDPNSSQSYQQAIEALYKVSYTLKFMVKRGETAVDYGVMPLEGLWWTPDMNDFSQERKDLWLWTAMIMQPEYVTTDLVDRARTQVERKGDIAAVDRLRFERFEEGQAAQVLHIGPYAEEAPTIARLHAFIAAQGGTLTGKHHEIYLSDSRRSAPERLKTVVRQPFS